MNSSKLLWYIRSIPPWYVIASTIAMILRSSIDASSTVWLTWWSEDATREDQTDSATFRVIVYAIIGAFYGMYRAVCHSRLLIVNKFLARLLKL